MKQAYDCGINFFDTAESYAAGQSEVVMGAAIKKYGWNRNDIVVTTKLNWGGANGEVLVNNHGLSRKHIIEGLKASLKRLDLDYVDVVYAHRPDRLTPMEETVRAFNHVIEQKGWALYWGTSEWSADEIAEACGIAKQLGLIGPIVEQVRSSIPLTLKDPKTDMDSQCTTSSPARRSKASSNASTPASASASPPSLP